MIRKLSRRFDVTCWRYSYDGQGKKVGESTLLRRIENCKNGPLDRRLEVLEYVIMPPVAEAPAPVRITLRTDCGTVALYPFAAR